METVDAVARWIALVWVLVLVYGAIRDGLKWFRNRQGEFPPDREKKSLVGAPRIDDLGMGKG